MRTSVTVPARAGTKEWLGLAVLTLPTLLLALDLSVLHMAAPQLSTDLSASSTQLLWILDIYGFMIAGFLVTMGTLGDRIGRRRLLLIGAAAFGLASILAAYSQSAEMLIVTRALLGIAGATLMPSTLALISNMFHDAKQRSLGIAVWMIAFTGGTAIGPIVGGVMLEHFWWGSVFLLGVPVMALLLILGPIMLPEFKDEKAGSLDLISVGLSLAAILPIIFALKEFAKNGPEPSVLIAAVIGAGFGYFFLKRQRQLADPLLNLTLFANRAFGTTLALMMLTLTLVSGIIMAFVQFAQLVKGYSALETGLWLLLPIVVNIVASILVPIAARYVRPALLVGPGIMVAALGLAILTQLSADGGMAVLMTGVVLVFLGTVPMIVLGTNLVVSSAPKHQAGSASSLSETAGELGAALGVAVFGSVMTAVYVRDMSAADLPGDVPSSALDNLAAASMAATHLSENVAVALLSQGQEAFTSGIVIGALGGAIALVILAVFGLIALRSVPVIGADDAAEVAAESATATEGDSLEGASTVAVGETVTESARRGTSSGLGA
ncbi:MFS transporter [Natronoglycomyces albus]|uniref:MFS transporter n=1 Tax=Natronoglycomyces albus TaxID=2811108 RepID=A0A895XJK6_9ACTN|nr:MFS transporter [Natronoglycomyces albus]QSB03992.1 MFS transporter [Natronoglycomyces albus]